MSRNADYPMIGFKRWSRSIIVSWPLTAIMGILALTFFLMWVVSIDFTLGKITEQIARSSDTSLTISTPDSPGKETKAESSSGRLSTKNASSSLPFVWTPRLLRNLSEDLCNTLRPLFEIDLSTITFFLWFLFMFYIFRGALCIARNRLSPALVQTFPFPRNFRITWVQLGLIGTLWGFLLLGFGLQSRPLMKSEETIELLVQAFGTALLSTFTGVALAYMFAPSVQWLFSRCLVHPTGPTIEENTSAEFVEWMQKVVKSLRSISEVIDTNRGALVDSFKSVADKVEASAKNLDQYFRGPKGPLKDIKEEVESLHDPLAQLEKNSMQCHKEAQRVRKGTASTLNSLQPELVHLFDKIGEKVDTAKTNNEKLHDEAQKVRQLMLESLREIRNLLQEQEQASLSLRNGTRWLGEQMRSLRQELQEARQIVKLVRRKSFTQFLKGKIWRRKESIQRKGGQNKP